MRDLELTVVSPPALTVASAAEPSAALADVVVAVFVAVAAAVVAVALFVAEDVAVVVVDCVAVELVAAVFVVLAPPLPPPVTPALVEVEGMLVVCCACVLGV